MPKPLASLSLDLDNKWSYLKTHGDAGWERFPSYLDRLVPRYLEFCGRRGLQTTVFVVGQDAALDENRDALCRIAEAGHEIGNHSFRHEPWLHLYAEPQIEEELARTEEHLERVTGRHPVGFRGPGFSFSPQVLRVLLRRGYQYDASTFPTFLGPLARAYYFCTARLSPQQKQERKQLFGKLSEGFRPLRPYCWESDGARLLEIPVTTMPLVRLPMHVSYLLYLAQFSRLAARVYFRTALRLCRLSGVAPSLLLHPLDFLGGDEEQDLAFFPAMGMPGAKKAEFVGQVIEMLLRGWEIVPLGEYARRWGEGGQPVEHRAAARAASPAESENGGAGVPR